MLIYLDASLNEYIQSKGTLDYKEINAIENIFISHKNRNHLVIAGRKCLETLMRLDGISTLTKRQIEIIDHDITTLLGVSNNVSTKIVVKPSNTSFMRNSVSAKSDILDSYRYENTIFEVPLIQFSNPELLEKTRLVAEHLDDCYFYEFIGNEFSELKTFPFRISFDRQHGGGNDTYRIFEEKILNQNIVFSLVDSDKRDNKAELGTTAKQVLEKYEQHKGTSIIGCEILPVHEKENLFPSIIYEHFGNNPRKNALEQLKILENSDVSCLYFPYIDIKKGMNSSNYVPYFEGLFDIKHLIPKTEESRRNFDNEFVGEKEEFIQYCDEQQKLPKSERVNKYLIEPLSSNPLVNFNVEKEIDKLHQSIEQLTHSKAPQHIIERKKEKLNVLLNISKYLLDYQKEYFRIVGTKIKEWGLSNHKYSTY